MKKAQLSTRRLERILSPPCEKCGGPTRLVGLEPEPTGQRADLCTYQCMSCGAVQVTTVPRPAR